MTFFTKTKLKLELNMVTSFNVKSPCFDAPGQSQWPTHEWFLLCLVLHLILEICSILILLRLFYALYTFLGNFKVIS